MKICMLADGGSIHTIRWCNHLAEQGHEIHLISFNNATIPNVHVYFIDAGPINVNGGNWKVILKFNTVKKILKLIQPDVLHAFYATSYGLVGALTNFHPYIVTPLGSDILISGKSSILYKWVLTYVFKRAECITSMAPHMTENMLNAGVSKEKIKDIIFGINTDIFNKSRRKLPEMEFVITSSRNFEAVYNLPHFLKAIVLLKDKIPKLKVNMIGDGSLKDELVELTKKLSIENNVTFLGKLPQDKLAELLCSSHIFVTVSLSDGNSLSLIEAMACGAYPIATDILANHEWVKEGINGSFVKIDDVTGLAEKIYSVYLHYDTLINKANAESEKIISEKGTWKINMLKMEKIYSSFSQKQV